MKQKQTLVLVAAGLILMVALTRIVNAEMNWYNFAPVVALGLFSGSVLRDKRYAFLFALLGQLLGDLYFFFFTDIQAFYGLAQLFTYAGLLAATFLGMFMKRIRPLNVVLFSIGGSVLFFIISNFGHFIQGWNGYSVAGLVKTFADAIPFFKNSLIGDLTGSVLLFSLYSLALKAWVKPARA